MVIPILAGLLGALGIGAAGAAVGASATKKGGSLISATHEGEKHAPYEQYQSTKTYSPQIQYPDYQIVMGSTGVSQSMKKTQEQDYDISPELQGAASNLPLVPIAIIGVLGFIGLQLLKKGK